MKTSPTGVHLKSQNISWISTIIARSLTKIVFDHNLTREISIKKLQRTCITCVTIELTWCRSTVHHNPRLWLLRQWRLNHVFIWAVKTQQNIDIICTDYIHRQKHLTLHQTYFILTWLTGLYTVAYQHQAGTCCLSGHVNTSTAS